jgi:hypothetical protein
VVDVWRWLGPDEVLGGDPDLMSRITVFGNPDVAGDGTGFVSVDWTEAETSLFCGGWHDFVSTRTGRMVGEDHKNEQRERRWMLDGKTKLANDLLHA